MGKNKKKGSPTKSTRNKRKKLSNAKKKNTSPPKKGISNVKKTNIPKSTTIEIVKETEPPLKLVKTEIPEKKLIPKTTPPKSEFQNNARTQTLFCNRIIFPVLYEWIQRARKHVIPITDEMLRANAQKIANNFNITEFHINFLYTFKKKYKLDKTNLIDYAFERIKANLGNSSIIHDDDKIEEKKSLEIENIMIDMEAKLKTQIDSLSNSMNRDNFLKITNQTKFDITEEVEKSLMGGILTLGRRTPIPFKIDETFINPIEIDDNSSGSQTVNENVEHEIKDYNEALRYLGPLEKFMVKKINFRGVGLVNQLEVFLKEEISTSK